MARRSGFAKKIDTVHWTLGQDGSKDLASGGTAAATFLPAQHLPETLMRIRGEWACALISTLAANSGAVVIAGLILVPEGTGTTVLWSPNADGDAPWIWWDVMHLLYAEYVVDAVVSLQAASGRRVIDSKAMRKVRNRELQLVIENADPGAFTGVAASAFVTARVLSGS